MQEKEEQIEEGRIKNNGGFLSLRNLALSGGALGAIFLLITLFAFLALRLGYIDSYIEGRLKQRFSDFGIKADIANLKTAISPASAVIEGLELSDEQSGEQLAKIGRLKIGLTVSNLVGLGAAREINVDSTDIEKLEVWVRFDENGRSNFSNLKFKVDEDPNLKISYASMNFSLKDAVVYYGDEMRKLSGVARNLKVLVGPEKLAEKKYRFDLSSEKSLFAYNDKQIEPIDIYAKGIADENGADIESLSIKAPLGESNLKGTLTDWQSPKYELAVASTIDLMQAGSILPAGAALRGLGNFSGSLKGEGEKYHIDGEIDSEALAADNIRIKSLYIAGKGEGENTAYNLNGKAIAELLTTGDFTLSLLQLTGNIRGTGTDFKWFGELRAASLKSPHGTLAGLFISDARAEYKDREISGEMGEIQARGFFSAEAEAEYLRASGLRVTTAGGKNYIIIPNAGARKLDIEGASFAGLRAEDARIINQEGRNDIKIGRLSGENLETVGARLREVSAEDINYVAQKGANDALASNLKAGSLEMRDAKAADISASGLKLRNKAGNSEITAENLKAGKIEAQGAIISGLTAPDINISINGNTTSVSAEALRAGNVATQGAVLGSVNVGGVRLKIREGRLEGESDRIDAEKVSIDKTTDIPSGGTLENVKLAKTVFLLEPSGRYRASMDMTLGGGALGSLRIGQAKANVVASNERIEFNSLNARIMEGDLSGDAAVALGGGNSSLNARFSGLDLAKLMALQGGRVLPIAGKTTGRADLTFPGTDFTNASGTLTAELTANAGTSAKGLVPLNGRIGVKAINGLFDIDYANFATDKSEINAKGRFDLDGEKSDLEIALRSSDAGEVQRLIKVLEFSPELDEQLSENQISLKGSLAFDGRLTGNIGNPLIDGRASLESISMREKDLGSLVSGLAVLPSGVELRNGKLRQAGGGSADFSLSIPNGGKNNVSLVAGLNELETGTLYQALPLEDKIPELFRDLKALASGKIDLKGLPGQLDGYAEINSKEGEFAGQPFDSFASKFRFENRQIRLEGLNVNLIDGFIRANGSYDRDSERFALAAEGRNLQVSRLRSLLKAKDIPNFAGTIDFKAEADGARTDFSTYDIAFEGSGREISVNDNALGNLSFTGKTQNRLLSAKVVANFEDQRQDIDASLDFGNERLPLRLETTFSKARLAPYIALFQPPDSVEVSGSATGSIYFGGELYDPAANTFITGGLQGSANFSEFGLQFNETPFIATDPVALRFSLNEVVVESARFAGAGSNVVVSGTKAFNDKGVNNLGVDGKINLRILDAVSRNTFYAGLAEVSVRLTGVNTQSRLSGQASVENASVSTFVSSQRLNFERIKGRILFNSNQAQIEQMVGYLGGGKVVGSGGALIEGLTLKKARLELKGRDVTAPLPKNYVTTGDAEVTITVDKLPEDDANGKKQYDTLIAGRIFGKRSLYTKDIDLADVLGARREGTINEGTTAPLLGIPKLDLQIEGREALFVKNNLADLQASVSLRVTGDVDYPQVYGRITATSGTLFFRNDRYEIRRGVLELPAQSDRDPIISLQAETDVKGYQIFVDLAGELSDVGNLSVTARSNPTLPQADVVSLITTGNLSNTDTGIPTLAQSGINTAANLLTDSLINNPTRRATDKLFGLNKFEIDPILSGKRLNPTARLTVGRQINKNLAITYSTNLSQEQNQVLAFEYRVSNKISFVAQYEQDSLSNVTRNNNNFSFEVRIRRRF